MLYEGDALAKTGEIVLRGATVMHGYENNPTVNEQTFSNGWFRTGNLLTATVDDLLEAPDNK
jgi:long-subunit acyl-CoA synthetase (AMP-forming)